jgi:hypothetical protein
MKVPTKIMYVDIDGVQNVENIEISWEKLRVLRNDELASLDWKFLSDQNPSQEEIDYRKFLRDLPQNFEDAWEAGEAWNNAET